MKNLATLQAAILQRLQKYRTHPPSFGERARLVTPYLGALLLLFMAMGYLVAHAQIPGGVQVVTGVYLGVLIAELGNQNRFVRGWPLNREITDWQKVEQLASGTTPGLLPIKADAEPKSRLLSATLIGVAAFVLFFGVAVAAHRAVIRAYDPTRNNPDDGVIILTASWCGYCMSLRHHLTEMNIHYTDLDVERTTEGSWAFTAVRAHGIPVTIVGDEVIRGLGKPDAQWEKVDRALRQAGYEVPAR